MIKPSLYKCLHKHFEENKANDIYSNNLIKYKLHFSEKTKYNNNTVRFEELTKIDDTIFYINCKIQQTTTNIRQQNSSKPKRYVVFHTVQLCCTLSLQ